MAKQRQNKKFIEKVNMRKQILNLFIEELKDNRFSSIDEVQEAVEKNKIKSSTVNYHKSYVQIHVLLQKKIPSMLIQYMLLFIEGFIDEEQHEALNKVDNCGYIQMSLYNEIVTSLYMLVEDGQGKDKTFVKLLPENSRYQDVQNRLKKIRNGINHFKLDMYSGKISKVSLDELMDCYLILLDELNKKYGNQSPLWINSFSDISWKKNLSESEFKIFMYYLSRQTLIKNQNKKRMHKKQ